MGRTTGRKRRKRNSSGRVLSFGRRAVMGGVAALLLVAAVWTSWDSAHHVVLAKGREHGTLAVARCADESCTGPYDPDGPDGPRAGMTIQQSVAVKKGERFPVVVKPGTDELVRSDAAGLLYAWVPLGGALLLASLVVGGGLRMTRTAWGTALAGAALLLATFFAL
ncbi:hypothetical protein ACIRQP_10415 [Streptomyces sp. NPDC102274]|uniref:hypothetical protein n=1 Tax=Streptomyces sp. NPDC102274 TaxID=3366151 RepID=UPI0037F4D086